MALDPVDAGGLAFLAGGGSMGAAIRAHDWRRSPLGPPVSWPQPLKTLVGLMLSCAQPMFIAWGREQTWLYNDAFTPILGRKHPGALGRPALAEVWSEATEVLSPLFERVFAGEPVQMQDFGLQLDRRGRLEEAHFAFSYTPVRDEVGAVVGLFGACIETTDQVMSQQRQAAAQARQRKQLEQAPGFIVIMRGPDHVVEFVNNAHRRLFGSAAWVGKFIRDAFLSSAGQGFHEHLDEVYRTGESYTAHAAPVRYRRSPTGDEETRYLDFIYAPLTDDDGNVTGVVCEGFDVTEPHHIEEQRRLLMRELEHRMKNVLAMVGAIVNQSFRGATSLDKLHRVIADRISVLARAHDILTQASWTSASFRAVVEGALAPHRVDGTRFRVSGPDIMLSPKVALSLALVINELATNAAKYRALSVPTGHVDISGSIDTSGPEPTFRFDWQEVAGPPATDPGRTGFGLKLVQHALAVDFSGEQGIEFASEGFHCWAATPLASLSPSQNS